MSLEYLGYLRATTNTLWPSLFSQKPAWNKPNKVKPALLSLLFGLDSVGVNATSVALVEPFRQSSKMQTCVCLH